MQLLVFHIAGKVMPHKCGGTPKNADILKSIYSLILIALICTSCSGRRTSVGVVRDLSSGLPISGVKCAAVGGNMMLSDSLGRFSMQGPHGTCLFQCKDLKIEFSKAGYHTRTVINPPNDNVYLSPE